MDPDFNRTLLSPVVCCQLSVLDFKFRFFTAAPAGAEKYKSETGLENSHGGIIPRSQALEIFLDKNAPAIVCNQRETFTLIAHLTYFHPAFEDPIDNRSIG
jgi:hypothetical protein